MRKQLFLLLTVLIVGSCALAAPKKTPAKKPLPVWQPAPALLKQLAPQSELPFGTIRLPRGYELFDFPYPFEAGTNLNWSKKTASGEVHDIFLMMQIPAEELGWQNLSLDMVFSEFMNGFRRRFDNARQTPAKQGLVKGRRTLRTDWNGTYRSTRVKLNGTIFMTRDATDVYVIQTGHRVNSAAGQRLTEAAALTFKVQSQN